MSTQQTPQPPDRPTNQASPPGAETQPQAAPEPEPAATLPLNEDMAKILEEQAEIIVQRQVYHSQMMVGVSALGSDPVSVRNAVHTLAKALRASSAAGVEHALVTLGDPQLQQINDHTLPFRFNAQVAGLFEGLVIDTLTQVYRTDSARAMEARGMLEAIFAEANEQAERRHKAQLAFLSPRE